MKQWVKKLQKLGFFESEAKLYLAALEFGDGTVQELSKAAGVSRATGYAAIEGLQTKGLITTVQKGARKYFQAESPERLSAVAKAEAARIEALASEIAVDIDELKLTQNGDKPIVKMYEGEDALVHIMDDMQKTKPEHIYEIENLDEFRRLYSQNDFSDHYQFLEKEGITRDLIFAYKDTPPTSGTELQKNYLVEGAPTFFGSMSVYANKVALSAFRGKQMTVLIESEIIADMMREMFQFILGKKSVKK